MDVLSYLPLPPLSSTAPPSPRRIRRFAINISSFAWAGRPRIGRGQEVVDAGAVALAEVPVVDQRAAAQRAAAVARPHHQDGAARQLPDQVAEDRRIAKI